MKYKNVKREEELKGKVGKEWFSAFDDTRILGNIDFCVSPKKQSNKKEPESLLWAEAKTKDFDTVAMYAQLIITIGKERTFDKHLPPAFLGAFDYKKFVFIPYNEVSDLFYTNDFNWNVAPSNHETKEFHLIKTRIEHILQGNKYSFDYEEDEKEFKHFIKHNLAFGSDEVKILIDKNNFVPIYLRWLTQVKPYIDFDWIEGKKKNILDSDFYLADLFVDDKGTASIDDDTPIKDELFVVFKNSRYEIAKENLKSLFNATIEITDKTKYEQFWKKYRREPLQEFQQYIIDRRDLLIPQDVRERKGAFFTPQIWVELSQKYLADVLGEEWQDEYYIWDCAAGTGNLLVGLTNRYNIWASTLDQADVNVMHERIKNGANLLPDQVFQFDFLNDDFSKLPKNLQNVINDPEKRKKLVIYINPPYAEATQNFGKNTKKAVEQNKINQKYSSVLRQANREVFAQFLTRIYFELDNVILAEFSKLKTLSGQHFVDFRNFFKAKLIKCFVVPADTFDNVKGIFPIGFKIWRLDEKEKFANISADVFDKNGQYQQKKSYFAYDNHNYINDWIKPYRTNKSSNNLIGKFPFVGNDFQTQDMVRIVHFNNEYIKSAGQFLISQNNLLYTAIYFTVRKVIPATWLNDRDQFLFPNGGWEKDNEFQSDCLAFTLFSNNIQSQYGTNHWIPFTEKEVNARAKFESSFMTDFIKGKLKAEPSGDLFSEPSNHRTTPLVFSPEATAVFDAGRELWKYYHSFKAINVNASLYDIREHFQGRNDNGKMNNKSEDQNYMQLITELRAKLKLLANKIAPKVYEYGFLKE
jgi:16S rRNA G966 N2-methylase RsmD